MCIYLVYIYYKYQENKAIQLLLYRKDFNQLSVTTVELKQSRISRELYCFF